MTTVQQKIGRYEIVSELGRGAMGLVYRALDPNIGRTVALKTLRLDVHGMEHDDLLRRFRYEARAAGAMNHPNIVTIYDADEVDGLFYIAMEYLEGQTLQSLMFEKRTLPADEIVTIAKQVAAGLAYAHQMKVIHRDIKPANIMITPQNVSKIMDFGISKVAGSMTSNSQVLGTPNYMAPEQVKGLELDGRADLFSFGVVLYEMATGERPFSGDNVTTIIYKIVNEQAIAPNDVNMSVHPGLSAIISKCLAKDPAQRYQTGAELVRALDSYQSLPAHQEATTVLPSSGARVRKPPNERPAGIATAAFASSSGTTAAGTAVAPAKVAAPVLQTAKRTAAVAPVRSNTRGSSKPKIAAIAVFTIAIAAAALYGMRHRKMQLSFKPPQPVEQAAEATPLPAPVAESATTAAPPQTAETVSESAPALQDKSEPTVREKTEPAPEKKREVKPVATHALNDANTEPSNERVPEKVQSAGKVEIRFTSNPSGAFVEIDGNKSADWRTPFTMANLTPGTHEVAFTKAGFSKEMRKLEIGPKNSSYNIDLVPETTAIALASDPPGASIEIDGQDTGKITPAQIPVSEGDHRVILHLDGYRNAQTIASVDQGQVFSFTPTLNPADAPQAGNSNPVTTRLGKFFGGGMRGDKGMIDFVTTPPGAKIFIQGRPMAFATPAHVPIPEGDYRIEFREPGYKPVQQNVHIEAGKRVKVQATLDPK